MLPNFLQRAFANPSRLLMCAAMAVALVACGGGGGSPGSTGTTPGTPGTPGTPTPVLDATITLSIVNASGTAVTTLSGSQTATVRALLKDSSGAVVPNAVVKFTVSDVLIAFSPSSGSALTDASGTASITISPADQSTGGAVSISANATVATKPVTSSVNLAVGPGNVIFNPTLTMSIVDTGGAPVSNLSGVQTATVKIVLKDSSGAVAPNAIVKFTTTDAALLAFTPDSGSALTDAAGVAQIIIKPSSVSASGAVGVTATSVVNNKTATASGNLSISSSPLTIGTLAFVPAPAASLPAFSSASLNIPITSGGLPANTASGLVVSSFCITDGKATLVLGPLVNGILPATYTNLGCVRGTDTITVTIGGSTKTINIGVDAANIGTIQFLGTDLAGRSIVLKGSGGLGRQESALLSFRVLDQNNQGLSNVRVDFTPSTTTGGLSIAPTFGTTDATGTVTTTVSSGTIPTPVRIFAQASRNGKTISGLSDTLIISTGLPIQKSMSLSVDSYNINGWAIDGTVANVTIRMADQYGNPISDDTAVSFVTEGGAIGTPAIGGCTTVGGGCTVQLHSQNFRPANGRVTILAYVQGLEDFVDSNGDGQYSCTNFTAPDGSVSPVYRPLTDICVSGGEPFTDQGDPFLDAGVLGSVVGFQNLTPARLGSFDGVYEAANGDLPFPYNHTGYRAAGDGKWGLNYIRATAEITFSDSVPNFVRQFCTATTCRDWVASDGVASVVHGLSGFPCSAQEIRFRLSDLNNNPMPAKTTVSGTNADQVVPGTASPDSVPSTSAIGGTIHTMVIKPEKDCKAGSFSVQIGVPGSANYSYGFTSAP